MEVREDRLTGTQQRPFALERLLDLDDHISLGEDLLRRSDDTGTVALVLGVGDATALTGILLDQHFVAGSSQLFDTDREHGNTVFVRFDFLGDSNNHGRFSNAEGARTDCRKGPEAFR